MTTTPPGYPADDDHASTRTAPPHDEGPRVSAEEVRDLGRLRRTRGDRRLAGVAGGLARHLDIDPLVVRVLLVVLMFFGGSGLVLYLALWILVPAEDTDRALVRLDPRSRSVALLVAGVLAALALLGDSAGSVGVPWPLVVLGLLVLLVVATRSAARSRPPAPPYPTPARVDRGPLLLWPTLAALALALGVLGVVEGTGTPVPGGAYPALALAVVGAMLLLGAFYGRPGGLIALGLVAAVATAGATVSDQVDPGSETIAPTSAGRLDPDYRVGAGEILVDLTAVQDLAALDGRTLELDAGLGRIAVLVPPGLDVVGRARVEGAGDVRAFGQRSSQELSLSHDGGPGAPTLTLDVEVTLGEITIDETGRTS